MCEQVAMRQGWVGASDFVATKKLEADLEGVHDEKKRRCLIRQERNRQSAFAARIRRCGAAPSPQRRI